MNLILLHDDDFVAADRVRLGGRRLEHVRSVHRAAVGDRLIVGRVDGACGRGEVTAIDEASLEMRVTLDAPPPPPLPVTLVLALPRPPSLRKVLQQATTMGVKRFALIGAARVERSFWGSSALRPAELEEELCLGLEQGRDTVRPEVELWPKLHAFLAERWPTLRGEGEALLAHPGEGVNCPCGQVGPRTVVVGPEGGFVPHEVERWQAEGCRLVSLGARPLRVETAVVALLARLVG